LAGVVLAGVVLAGVVLAGGVLLGLLPPPHAAIKSTLAAPTAASK
jgi:hypothetical protein